jgi:glycosyltransferase involved in cell wall biosynthesis
LETDYSNFEILVANCGASDDFEVFLSGLPVDVINVPNSLGNAYNTLFIRSDAPVLVLTPDDVLYKPDWLKESLRQLKDDTIVSVNKRLANFFVPFAPLTGYRETFSKIGAFLWDFENPVGRHWNVTSDVIEKCLPFFSPRHHEKIRSFGEERRVDVVLEWGLRALSRGVHFQRPHRGRSGIVMHAWDTNVKENPSRLCNVIEKFLGTGLESYGVGVS